MAVIESQNRILRGAPYSVEGGDMFTSGLEYDASNNISGYSGSAFRDWNSEIQSAYDAATAYTDSAVSSYFTGYTSPSGTIYVDNENRYLEQSNSAIRTGYSGEYGWKYVGSGITYSWDSSLGYLNSSTNIYPDIRLSYGDKVLMQLGTSLPGNSRAFDAYAVREDVAQAEAEASPYYPEVVYADPYVLNYDKASEAVRDLRVSAGSASGEITGQWTTPDADNWPLVLGDRTAAPPSMPFYVYKWLPTGIYSSVEELAWKSDVSGKDWSTEIQSSLDSAKDYTDSMVSSIGDHSANWETAFNIVSGNSGIWSSTYETVNTASAGWESTYQTVHEYSSTWDSFADKLDISAFSSVSGDFLTEDDISGKLDTSAFSSVSGDFLTEDDISGKLDTSAFSSVSGTFLTAHQPISGDEWNEAYDTLTAYSSVWNQNSANGGIYVNDYQYIVYDDISATYAKSGAVIPLATNQGGVTFYNLASSGNSYYGPTFTFSKMGTTGEKTVSFWKNPSTQETGFYTGSSAPDGKTYTGVKPVVVDNTANTVAVATLGFSARAPLYVEQNPSNIVICDSGNFAYVPVSSDGADIYLTGISAEGILTYCPNHYTYGTVHGMSDAATIQPGEWMVFVNDSTAYGCIYSGSYFLTAI